MTFQHLREEDITRCELLFARALRPVASDLRLIDLAALVDLVRREQVADLADLVASAAELDFAPGALRFSGGALCGLDWGRAPAIALDVEFAGAGVFALLRLTLGGRDAGVEIRAMTFSAGPAAAGDRAARLAEALETARRQPRASSASHGRIKDSATEHTSWRPSPSSPSPPDRPNG